LDCFLKLCAFDLCVPVTFLPVNFCNHNVYNDPANTCIVRCQPYFLYLYQLLLIFGGLDGVRMIAELCVDQKMLEIC
jgi:hypothetical protein